MLDAGAFVAVERDAGGAMARLWAAQRHGVDPRTSAIVLGQGGAGAARVNQSRLAGFLRAVDVRSVDERMGRRAGVLLARAGAGDAIDATVVLVAESGDRILTSDAVDIGRLAAGPRARVPTAVAC